MLLSCNDSVIVTSCRKNTIYVRQLNASLFRNIRKADADVYRVLVIVQNSFNYTVVQVQPVNSMESTKYTSACF